jgi:hypothetical protein
MNSLLTHNNGSEKLGRDRHEGLLDYTRSAEVDNGKQEESTV